MKATHLLSQEPSGPPVGSWGGSPPPADGRCWRSFGLTAIVGFADHLTCLSPLLAFSPFTSITTETSAAQWNQTLVSHSHMGNTLHYYNFSHSNKSITSTSYYFCSINVSHESVTEPEDGATGQNSAAISSLTEMKEPPSLTRTSSFLNSFME